MKILIVDDSQAWASTIVNILKRADYDSDVVDNGNEAIRAVETGIYQIALIDLGLPDISGVNVARQLREHGVLIPFFLISGDITRINELDLDEACFSEVIQKPIIPSRLIELINKHTGNTNQIALRSEFRNEMAGPSAPLLDEDKEKFGNGCDPA